MRPSPILRRAAPLACHAAIALAALPASAQALFNLGGGTAAVPVTSLRDMPFKTVVRQQYDYSCGSAALATLLTHHYGRPTGEAAIFKAMYEAGDKAKIEKAGFSLLDMKRYLQSQGLDADGYRWSMEDLQRSQSPVIALINVGSYRHFVIIKGVRRGRVMVGDPAQGIRLFRLDEFRRMWTGTAFRISPKLAGPGLYDGEKDWRHFTLGPMTPLDDTALASFTRDLPPIYQIVAFRDGGGAVR